MMNHLGDLEYRICRALDQGKGIRLSPADLDLLCSIGGLDLILKAVGEEYRKAAEERVRVRLEAANP